MPTADFRLRRRALLLVGRKLDGGDRLSRIQHASKSTALKEINKNKNNQRTAMLHELQPDMLVQAVEQRSRYG
ncbi:hypothetical protein [uncultured Senegalimassilia sp.]|uniref:hypothetical protein n=1 Tax=uncultured Senegalimassilia sp. TaxID=1714350 RepID=UPI0026E0DEE8|nr:hypothetical protein [uncultured Senegalimassilia sp.]